MPYEQVYIESVCFTNAMNAVADLDVTRNSMAELYADYILSRWNCSGNEDTKALNKAIMERWPKGLNYIKTRAWRIVGERRKAATT